MDFKESAVREVEMSMGKNYVEKRGGKSKIRFTCGADDGPLRSMISSDRVIHFSRSRVCNEFKLRLNFFRP